MQAGYARHIKTGGRVRTHRQLGNPETWKRPPLTQVAPHRSEEYGRLQRPSVVPMTPSKSLQERRIATESDEPTPAIAVAVAEDSDEIEECPNCGRETVGLGLCVVCQADMWGEQPTHPHAGGASA